MKMSLILLFAGNAYIFIVCLVGATTCYFRRRRKWFWLMLACVVISTMCAAIALTEWLTPPHRGLPTVVIRQPTTPL